MGVVQSVDAGNGSLTIAHEPIAALGWPAMTMSFKVDKPVLLEGVEAGQHIEFTLRGRDMSAIVTSIEKAE
jgi:Cu(I)/Ag(I) efflux system protein CusF